MLEKIIQTGKLYSAAAVMALSIGACQQKPEAFGVYASDKGTELSASNYNSCNNVKEEEECVEGIRSLFGGELLPTKVKEPVFYAHLPDPTDIEDFEIWGPLELDLLHKANCRTVTTPNGVSTTRCDEYYSTNRRASLKIIPLDYRLFRIEAELEKDAPLLGIKKFRPYHLFNRDQQRSYVFQVE